LAGREAAKMEIPVQMRLLPAALLSLVMSCSTFGQTYTIHTVAGTGGLDWPSDVAVDAAGNLFVADVLGIHKVSNGVVTTVAGGGYPGLGDNGPATSAYLYNPGGVALDSAGNVYIADQDHTRIRKVSNGVITTVAGNGTQGFSGDNGPATSAQLYDPERVTVDSAGNLYIADTDNYRIRKVSNGVITTVAGNGGRGFNGDNILATSAQLHDPFGVAVDSAGNLYIADFGNNRIRKVSNGVITTVAGNGTAGFSGDNGSATSAQLYNPVGVALDSAGNLYIADGGNFRIRKVSNGVITTVAGNGTPGYGGDNGPATSAQFYGLSAVAVDSAGNVYIADSGNDRICVLTPVSSCTYSVSPTAPQVSGSGGNLIVSIQTGASCLWAVSGLPGWITVSGATSGVGSAAVTLVVSPNTGAARSGTISVAGVSVTTTQAAAGSAFGQTYTISTVAGNGTGTDGFSGDNGPATSAGLDACGVSVDPAGIYYIADCDDNRVRKVTNGVITTVAGSGNLGFSGDNGPAASAQLYVPAGVAVDPAGNLYIADLRNSRVRKVSNGVIITVAGNGVCCDFSGDNGPAASAQLYFPQGVAVDPGGNLYIADTRNNRIRKVTNGVITTVAGSGNPGFSGDNGPAASAQLYVPAGVAVDSAGNLYIADTGNSRIRKVTNGVITTVAGSGNPGFSGDNGPAASAQLSVPAGVAVDSAGNIYIADNARIRILTPCAFSVGPVSLQASASGGTLTVAIQTTASCFWAVSGLPGWITVSGASSGNGSGSVTLVVAANSGTALSATISIAGVSVTVSQPTAPLSTIKGVTNAASYATGAVSPGELVTIFGTAIGPATAVSATTDPATGKLATTIGGVQVLFNGTAAPMIYASSTQVSAVVPYEMAPVVSPSVWIKYLGQTSNVLQLTSTTTVPGLFTQNASGSGPGAILNQDNSLNGPGNRAAKGSIVQVYMTGEGQTSPPSVTGTITTATLPPPQVTPAPLLAVGVTINGLPALYVYAGEAPGLVAGMMQLNVQIPANAASGDLPIVVSIGGKASQNGVTVSVQ